MTMLLLALLALTFLLVFRGTAHGEGLPSLKVLSTPSCPACAQRYRMLDDLGAQYAGKVTTEKINLYEHQDVAKQYKVKYVPHLIFVDTDGKVVKEKIGAIPLDEVLETFREAGVELG
jgi:thioredoxin 1